VIALDHNHRSSKPRAGSSRLWQVGPPDLALHARR
jgi:hypothetical protein